MATTTTTTTTSSSVDSIPPAFHNSALLRAAITTIGSRESSSAKSDAAWENNVVVSHPPSPRSLMATQDPDDPFINNVESLRPLKDIAPLDPRSLNRLPLSTPPRTPPHGKDMEMKAHQGMPSSKSEGKLAEEEESRFPLILVTGGCGFIGSHTVLEILQEGHYGVVVIDNLANANIEVLHRVRILAQKYHVEARVPVSRRPPLYFHSCDIRNISALSSIFDIYAVSVSKPTSSSKSSTSTSTSTTATPIKRSRIASAIHFAALKSVAGSLIAPISYYQVNVGGTLNLIELLTTWGSKTLVFSSSCVVYGESCDGEGIVESMCDVVKGSSKDGRTKRMCEEILADVSASDKEWQTMALRYTNPSGAHPSGYIGEDPTNAANLMPIVTHVLQGKREHVSIFGADYDTPDGTGVRDFIHVVDLAKAHLAAIRHMQSGKMTTRNSTYNLGTNKGTSVLTVIETLSVIAQRPIKIVVCPRRPGDLGCVVCSTEKAELELGWKAEKGVVEMCRDLVNWQALNPDGYSTKQPDSL